MNIKGVQFNNIPNKKLGTQITTRITQSNVGNMSNEEYLNSENYYKLFNGIDIDWNGIQIDENTEINDTADFIILLKSLLTRISQLELKVNGEEPEEPEEQQTYTVIFKDGDTILNTITGVTGTDISAPNPTKEGYTLYGWSEDSEHVDEQHATMILDKIGDGDKTYYAIWSEIQQDEPDLEIDYEAQDGNSQIINPDEPDLEINYESEDGNIQVVND